MADAFTDFAINTLVWTGLIVLMFAPIAILFLLRNKVSWMPGRVPFDIWVYKLRPGSSLDEKGRVKEGDIELSWKNIGWRITEKKIPKIYVQYQAKGFKGFNMDAAGLALLRNYDRPTIRLLERAPGIRQASNFLFIDVPDKLDPIQVSQSVSAMGEDLRDILRTELTRPQVDDLWKAVALPIMGMIITVLIIILALNWSQQLFDKTIAAGAGQVGEMCHGWADLNGFVPKNTTIQAPAPNPAGNLIPFQTTS